MLSRFLPRGLYKTYSPHTAKKRRSFSLRSRFALLRPLRCVGRLLLLCFRPCRDARTKTLCILRFLYHRNIYLRRSGLQYHKKPVPTSKSFRLRFRGSLCHDGEASFPCRQSISRHRNRHRPCRILSLKNRQILCRSGSPDNSRKCGISRIQTRSRVSSPTL